MKKKGRYTEKGDKKREEGTFSVFKGTVKSDTKAEITINVKKKKRFFFLRLFNGKKLADKNGEDAKNRIGN